jgi:hypothetical protein
MDPIRIDTGKRNVLGEGKHGVVYRLEDRYAVKVHHPHVAPEVLARDYLVGLALQGRGYPVAKPFGTRPVKVLGSESVEERYATGLLTQILPGVNIKKEVLLACKDRRLHDELEQRVFELLIKAKDRGFGVRDEGTHNAMYDPLTGGVHLFDFASWGLIGELLDPETGTFLNNKVIRLK